MDLNKLNEITDQISSDSQARATIETSVARAINELRYNGHAVVDLPKGISFDEFKSIAAEYINENWGNSIFSGKLDLQFSPLGDKVSIRNKGGIASTSDSIVTDGVDPRKYIDKIKQEGHEVVNGNGLYELVFEDDILQGDTDTDFSNLDEFIDTVVQGGKSRYGLYVIELPDCNFYSLEEFARHKNYMNDVEEEDITDTITEPDNLDDWIYECTSKGDFYGEHYFQCTYHGHDIELKYDENKWNIFIDGELIHDWDHLDDCNQDGSSDYKLSDAKFNIDTIYSKAKEATKTPISVRCNSASSMTTAMKKMFKRMGLQNTVEVTKSSEFANGIYYHYYHFFVDDSEVQTTRTHSMDGNIGKFDFFSCVNDCIIHAIVKNENLTGEDKQAVEDIFDIYSTTAPDWKSSGYKVHDAAEGEVSFANVTNDTIFVLCNGHISKRFNSVENANKWINSTFNPSQFTLAKRENGVLTEI